MLKHGSYERQPFGDGAPAYAVLVELQSGLASDVLDLEDVLDHFHFNREWWYQRVRIYPPPPEKGATNMEMIRDFISNNEDLNRDFIKPEYQNYFRNIMLMSEHCYYHLGQIMLIKKMLNQENARIENP